MSHPLQLLLLLALIVAASKLAGAASLRVGQPAVFGEILVGVLLGPTALDLLGWPLFAPPADALGEASPGLLAVVRDLADIGVTLLMFVAGLETDVAEMRRVGRVAFWAAAGGVLVPFAGGIATAAAFGVPVLWEGVFTGAILTATSVSISAQTLMELGALRTKEGLTILGAAVIDDVMGILVLSVVVALARAGGVEPGHLAAVVLRMTLYFAGALALGRALARVAAWADRLGVSQGLLAAVVVVAFLYAWAAEWVGGVAAITGAYLAGVMFAQTPYKSRIEQGIHPLTYSLLVPVFFVSIGLRANGRALGPHVAFTVVLIAVAIAGKVLGCAALARASGFTGREAWRVGVGMISRGEVGLIVAGYGLGHGIIGPEVFSASVLMVLVTTMVTPPLLRLAFPRAAPARR
jgi:Kef-type K+ transport system membrane component KefB